MLDAAYGISCFLKHISGFGLPCIAEARQRCCFSGVDSGVAAVKFASTWVLFTSGGMKLKSIINTSSTYTLQFMQ